MTPFGPWLPDVMKFNPSVSTEARNVIPPSTSGFGPFPSFNNVTSAITARVQGAFSARGLTGTIYNFAGDVSKLYQMANDGLSFNDVTRVSGGSYTTASDAWWQFAQFGDYVMAVNQADDSQVFQMSASTNFAAMSGSPPRAAFCGSIRDFAVLARVSTNFNRIQWSGINDITAWTPSSTTMSDYQDFPDGGVIKGFVGGEYGVVLQERAIQRMAFEGPPLIFRFDKISNTLGCQIETSIASYENLIFFKSHDGFYMIRGGSEIVPIGVEKVDKWFAENVDASFFDRCSAAIDPSRKLYLIGFPSTSATSGLPDRVLMYHWPSGEWSYAVIDHELLYTSATQSSYTIDGLASLSATIDGLTYPVDSLFYSGSGQLLLSGFDSSHRQGFFTGQNLEARVETGEVQLTQGRKSLLRSVRPMLEASGATPTVTIRYRDRLQDAVNDGPAVAANSNGVCFVRHNARYHRARTTIPAGETWTRALGIDDINFSSMGAR